MYKRGSNQRFYYIVEVRILKYWPLYRKVLMAKISPRCQKYHTGVGWQYCILNKQLLVKTQIFVRRQLTNVKLHVVTDESSSQTLLI
jgi:hypothetical protein